eukprot:186795_1
MALVLLKWSAIIAVSISADACIRLHPNYTIDYISNNINVDPSIRYLGIKSSATDCQNSCQDFNYLCDTSSSNIMISNNVPSFDNANCKITFPKSQSTIIVTDDLVAKEYIIEAQVTATEGFELAIVFKNNDNETDTYDYYFAIDFGRDHPITGYDFGGTGNFKQLSIVKPPTLTIAYDRMYTLAVHVNGNHFITYVEGLEHFSTYANPSRTIDESLWTKSYAGVQAWAGGGTVHSFKVIFPNASDHEDEKMDASLSPDTDHDSAILYEASACPSTAHPTIQSANPTNIPSAYPTKFPMKPTGTPTSITHDPTKNPATEVPTTKTPTEAPTRKIPTIYIAAHSPTRKIPTIYIAAHSPTRDGYVLTTAEPENTITSNTGHVEEEAGKADSESEIMTIVAAIAASLIIICLCLGIVFVCCKYYAKDIKNMQNMEKNKEDASPREVMVDEQNHDRTLVMDLQTDRDCSIEMKPNRKRSESSDSEELYGAGSDNVANTAKGETADENNGVETGGVEADSLTRTPQQNKSDENTSDQ